MKGALERRVVIEHGKAIDMRLIIPKGLIMKPDKDLPWCIRIARWVIAVCAAVSAINRTRLFVYASWK